MKIVVGFSGGADSQATAALARQQHGDDVILLNADPGGNEHPITTDFIDHYSRTVYPVVVVHPIIADLGGLGTMPGATRDRRREYDDSEMMTFADLAYIKGRWPWRKAQFCTEHLKLAPSRRWCRENLVAGDFERWAGVRRDESQRRANTPIFDWDDYFDCIIRYPVHDWSKDEVFDLLRAIGEPINPLYTMGFSRVGCAPCINSGKEDIRNWAVRAPEMIDKVREWESFTQRTFFAPCVPGLAINWIDEVVAWSMTERGGRTKLPEADMPKVGACSSKYGLCE